jgi:hypothetical protein
LTISEAAITQADSKAKEEGLDISFIQDDIFKSRLDQEFDFGFDRGCFHVFHSGVAESKYEFTIYGCD